MSSSPNPRVGAYRPTPHNGPAGRAFHIETPPRRMELIVDASLLRALNRATFLLGRHVGIAEGLPTAEPLLEMALRLEALLSSRIEGTGTSLRDLVGAEGRGPDSGDDDLLQVENHLKLLRSLRARKRADPLTIGELEAAHRTLLSGTLHASSLGRLRKVQNWIGAPGPFGVVAFIPPPPKEVPRALKDLVDFVNHDRRFPPLVKAAVAHCYFETIHPFVDGNGRIGRYLIHFILWREGVLEAPILYLSQFFWATRAEYYARLQACRDARGLTAFCQYMTDGIADVAEASIARSHEVAALRARHESLVRTRFGARSGPPLQALGRFYSQPIADIATLADWSGMSLDTGYRMAEALQRLGILKPLDSGRRNKRYSLHEFLEIFTVDDDPE